MLTTIRLALAFAVVVVVLPGPTQAAKKFERIIPTNSAIYVDSNNGFEVFMMAAFHSKDVPLRIVNSREKADYVLDSVAFHTDGIASVQIGANGATTTTHASEAAIKLTNQTGEVVWAYAVTKGWRWGNQSIAEACAKHLKEIIKP